MFPGPCRSIHLYLTILCRIHVSASLYLRILCKNHVSGSMSASLHLRSFFRIHVSDFSVKPAKTSFLSLQGLFSKEVLPILVSIVWRTRAKNTARFYNKHSMSRISTHQNCLRFHICARLFFSRSCLAVHATWSVIASEKDKIYHLHEFGRNLFCRWNVRRSYTKGSGSPAAAT